MNGWIKIWTFVHILPRSFDGALFPVWPWATPPNVNLHDKPCNPVSFKTSLHCLYRSFFWWSILYCCNPNLTGDADFIPKFWLILHKPSPPLLNLSPLHGPCRALRNEPQTNLQYLDLANALFTNLLDNTNGHLTRNVAYSRHTNLRPYRCTWHYNLFGHNHLGHFTWSFNALDLIACAGDVPVVYNFELNHAVTACPK